MNNNSFKSELLFQHAHTKARVMKISTPHGSFISPTFMPVGTRAGVNNLTPKELLACGSQIILGGNTYHMLCAPGMQIIEEAGGMHPFMGWHGPMLTDSGGFQIFSLSKNKLCTIDEIGAHFTLPGTSNVIHMTPQTSLKTQKIIGADIIMAFDQCTSDQFAISEVEKIMHRTHRWLLQSIRYHEDHPNSCYGFKQALFGIIQGGIYSQLRQESAAFITAQNLDGIAIGGETIGFDMEKTIEILHWIDAYLPREKPRYTMGVGMSPQDLLDVVKEGIDIFDCVAPTRNARHGALYCGEVKPKGNWLTFDSPFEQGRLQIKKSEFAQDLNPITPNCSCYTCQHYSRARLHDLFKQKAASFTALACIHNIHTLHHVCKVMVEHITSHQEAASHDAHSDYR